MNLTKNHSHRMNNKIKARLKIILRNQKKRVMGQVTIEIVFIFHL